MSGKGSKPRPFSVSNEEYSKNYEAIFKPKQPTTMKEYILTGFTYDVRGVNDLIVPKDIAIKAVNSYIEDNDIGGNSRAVGELGLEDGIPTQSINLKAVSHIVTDLYWDGPTLKAKVKLLDTPRGLIAQQFKESELRIAYRGSGTTKDNVVTDDFKIVSFNLETIERENPDEGQNSIWSFKYDL